MITVMQLLAHPIFKGFRLDCGSSGLYNAVSGTAIFEWESKGDVEATFEPGEFVLTTLSIAKDDISIAEDSLRILIERKVAAIAIKTVYHHQVSDGIIAFADERGVPIFFFEDTYIDDLIYNIKNSLMTDELNVTALKLLRSMLTETRTGGNCTRERAKQLNPFFYDNCICCCCFPKNPAGAKVEVSNYYSFYESLSQAQLCVADTSHLMIKCNKAIVLIFTGGDQGDDLRRELLTFLSDFEITTKEFRIGVSQAKEDLELLGMCVWESIFAALTCVMDNETFLDFNNIGINGILFSAYKTKWTRDYYEGFREKLTRYDEEHNSNLHYTLLQYIKSGGDMVLTADKLFQHSNTIRYRLGKIKELLGISYTTDAYVQMHVYARLHEITELLKGEDLI